MTRVTAKRSGTVVQIGRPSSTSHTTFDARMNAAIYPEADHSASTSPTTNRIPAVLRCDWMFWIALVKICRASPGAALPRFWISDWVTE